VWGSKRELASASQQGGKMEEAEGEMDPEGPKSKQRRSDCRQVLNSALAIKAKGKLLQI
jgi:hypothetical protein